MLRFLLPLLVAGGVVAAQTLPPEARLVMSHFKSNGGGGDERLWISWSPDGIHWTALNGGNPVWQPPGTPEIYSVVRDPTIIFHEGYYWVAYTSGSYGRGNTFGLIKSADLLNWTIVTAVDASVQGATDPFTWSPIFFEDGDGSIHVIVAISRVSGFNFDVFPDLHVYEMHPVSADWTQWSTPVPLDLPDPNNNDCWVWKEGTTYHAAYADFARGGAVVHATSQNLVTGWVRDRVLGYNSQEGNIVLPIPGGGYRLYLEVGNGTGGTPSTYRTADWTQDFSSATPQVSVISDVPMRNGKICAARGTETFATWRSRYLSSLPSSEQSPSADPEADGMTNLAEYSLGTDPTSFSPGFIRPQSYVRTLAGQQYGGIIFPWLRQAADMLLSPELLVSPGVWSSAPADVIVESLTLMSDGTTRVQARSTRPVAASAATLLRTRTTASAPLPITAPQAHGKARAKSRFWSAIRR
jgi:hypothetical protein